MKDACFVAPIHPPKFDYGLKFVESYNRYFSDNHLFLVFSSEHDSLAFAEIAQGLRYRSIICSTLQSDMPTTDEKWLPIKSLFENSGFQIDKDSPFLRGSAVTEKKFYGLNWIFENTDFKNVAAVDVDCVFTRNADYAELFDQYNRRGIVYANTFDYAPYPIINSPLRFFNSIDQEKLKTVTDHGKVYFWFNDVPVYNRDYFTKFMQYIHYPQIVKHLACMDFDYIIYAYYLIVQDIFKLEILTLDGAAMNFLFIEGQSILSKEDFIKVFLTYRPMWVKEDLDPSLMSGTFLNLHVDRP